jgi:hypothetical protein
MIKGSTPITWCDARNAGAGSIAPTLGALRSIEVRHLIPYKIRAPRGPMKMKEVPIRNAANRWRSARGTARARADYPVARCCMSKEKPTDDPREQSDWKTTKQTDQPWKRPLDNDQKSGVRKDDLEKWNESKTH